MRLFAKLTAWFCVTLALSILAFGVTTRLSRPPEFDDRRRSFKRRMQFKLETAVRAWQQEGAAGLRATLERMDEMFPKGHFLLDAEARDVLTGEDRSALRARSQRRFNGSPHGMAVTRWCSRCRRHRRHRYGCGRISYSLPS